MKVGLIDVDRFTFPCMTFPNLALMKISAYHKARGDEVAFCTNPLTHYDIVYQTKVFTDDYAPDIDWFPNAETVIKGGSGYDMTSDLPDEIEHIYPDYHLYDGTPAEVGDKAYGFLTRGCPRSCPWCIVGGKEGTRSRKVADLSEFWRGQREIVLLDPNLMACPDRLRLLWQLADSGAWVNVTQGFDARLCVPSIVPDINAVKIKRIHFAWDNPSEDLEPRFAKLGESLKIQDHRRRIVYILTNYNSTLEQDLHRVYTVEKYGFDADVRVFDKPNAPREIRDLQRWCNNRVIHAKCPKFEDYKTIGRSENDDE